MLSSAAAVRSAVVAGGVSLVVFVVAWSVLSVVVVMVLFLLLVFG